MQASESIQISPLCVFGKGMVSSLGLDYRNACAAARAGMTRVQDLPLMVPDADLCEEVPVSGHTVGDFTLGFSELGLWVRLAVLGLHDLSQQVGVSLKQLAQAPTLIGVTSGYHWDRARESMSHEEPGAQMVPWDQLRPWYEQGLFAKIYHQCGAPVPKIRALSFGDEAGIASLLIQASSLIERGHPWVVVGAVDSTADLPMAKALARLRLLKTVNLPVGQMPGESAAFLLLGRAGRPGDVDGRPVIAGLAVAQDPNARCESDRASGVGYARAIMRSVELSGMRPRELYVDLNGEPRRAYDWGSTLVRLPDELRNLPTTYPVASFGSIRAAYGLVSTIYCAYMFERVASARVPTMVVCGSDDGQRAAFFMTPS